MRIALAILLLAAFFGESLAKDTPSDAEQTYALFKKAGSKVVLTRAAVAHANKVGVERLLKSESATASLNGWTVIHLPYEALDNVVRGMSANAKLLREHRGTITASNRVKLRFKSAKIDSLATVARDTCGLDIRFDANASPGITVIMHKDSAPEVFCEELALILAANKINLEEQNGKLIARDVEVIKTPGRFR